MKTERTSPRFSKKFSKSTEDRPTARKSTGGGKKISKEVAIKMENHSTTAIKVGKNDRDCPKCGKVLASASTLKKHIEDKHTASDGYACPVCGKWAKTRNSLGTHMSRSHRGVSAKTLPVLPWNSKSDEKLPLPAKLVPTSPLPAKLVQKLVFK